MPTNEHVATVAGAERSIRRSPERSVNLTYKCRALVDNDPDAGALLAFVVRWHRKARLRRKGEPGVWNANARAFIIHEAGLGSKNRLYRARDKCLERGVLHWRHGGFSGRPAIWTRPDPAAVQFIETSMTRDEVAERAAGFQPEQDERRDYRRDEPRDYPIPSDPLIPSNPINKPDQLTLGGEGRIEAQADPGHIQQTSDVRTTPGPGEHESDTQCPGEHVSSLTQPGEQVSRWGQPGEHAARWAQPGEHAARWAQPGEHAARSSGLTPPDAPTTEGPETLPPESAAGPGATMVPHPEGEDDLLARVREVKGLELSGYELRLALLEQLPRVSGPHKGTVSHPADLHRDFARHSWTPELLVKRYRDYLGMIDRWRRAHPDRVRRHSANAGVDLPDLDDGDEQTREELAWDRATHGRNLFDVNEYRHDHYRRTGEWLPLSKWRKNEDGLWAMVERGPLREYPKRHQEE